MRYDTSRQARDYLRKRMGKERPFREAWIKLAVSAYINRYGMDRVWAHRSRLEDALASVYARVYAEAFPEDAA